MCGFAALFERDRIFPGPLLADIDRDLFHRGPDSGGCVVEPGLALVFRRLSILDPTPQCDQPISDSTGRYTLVFNGEIYNFKRLRRELEAAGVAFRTNGDTEVLLQALITWGEAALDRLEGMYAFVLLDRKSASVLVARDAMETTLRFAIREGGRTVGAGVVTKILA